MTRQQQMIVASAVFGLAVALAAMYAPTALVPIAMIGGTAIGLGWAFFVKSE